MKTILVVAAAAVAALIGVLPQAVHATDCYYPSPKGEPAKVLYKDIGGGKCVPAVVTVDAAGATDSGDVVNSATINAATSNATYTVLINGQGTVGFTLNGLTGTGATLTLEGSNDGGTTWSTVNSVDGGTGVLSSSYTANGQFRVNAGGRTRIRLRVSVTGTGTITVASAASRSSSLIALSSPLPAGNNVIGKVDINSAPTLAVQGVSGGQPLPIAGQTPNTVMSASNPLAAGLYSAGGTALAVASSNSDTLTTNSSGVLVVDAWGRLYNTTSQGSRAYQIDQATAAATGVQAVATAGASWTNVTTATTTTVKSGAGIWQSLLVNTPAATTVTCYNNTAASGSKIMTLTTVASTQPYAIPINLYFSNGLTCVTANTIDLTFVWR